MAKKKVAKKAVMGKAPACSPKENCGCVGILALAIIILAWWKPAVMWSQITITIAAAIILLSGHSCCKK
jgi:hypothetical protein